MKELKAVIDQLEGKIRTLRTEIEQEREQKDRYHKKYQEAQDRLVQLEAQLENGCGSTSVTAPARKPDHSTSTSQ